MRLQKKGDNGVWALSGAVMLVTRWDIEAIEDTDAGDFVSCLGVDRQGQSGTSKHAWPRWRLWHEMVLTPKEEVEA